MPRPALVNSPLVEVVYEVKFSGSFAVMSGLAQIQEALRDEYPKVLVPNLQDLSEAPALKHYRFASPDLLDTVGVAINSFLFSTKRYGVFEQFRDSTLRLLEVFRGVYQPPHFTRLGLRFTNILPLEQGTTQNVHPWLQLGVSVPRCLGRPLAEFQGNLVFEYDDGARLRVMTGKAQQTRELAAGGRHQMVVDGFLLDLDCYREGDIPPGEDVAFLTTAHGIIDAAFFDLLTPGGRALMEGRQ